MIPTTPAVSSGLTWSKIKGGFELSQNGQAVGSLQRTGFWSTSFHAETHDQKWTFRRGNCFGTKTEIIDAGTGQPVGTFDSGWSTGGTLAFPDGTTVRIRREGFWRPVWIVSGLDGQAVLRMYVRDRRIESVASSVTEPRLALIMLLVLYRMWQAEQDAATVAVLVAATG